MAITAEKLEIIRELGSEFHSGPMHRIYIDDLPTWYGLVISSLDYYGHREASLDGRWIPEERADRISSRLRDAKLWLDMPTGQWRGSDMDADDFSRLVERVMARVAEIVARPAPTLDRRDDPTDDEYESPDVRAWLLDEAIMAEAYADRAGVEDVQAFKGAW